MKPVYDSEKAADLLDQLFTEISDIAASAFPDAPHGFLDASIVDDPDGGAVEIIQSSDGLVQAWIEFNDQAMGMRTAYNPTIGILGEDDIREIPETNTRACAKRFFLEQLRNYCDTAYQRAKWSHARSFSESDCDTPTVNRSHSLITL